MAPQLSTPSPSRRPPPPIHAVSTTNHAAFVTPPSLEMSPQKNEPSRELSLLLYPPSHENHAAGVHLWNAEEIASKARELLNKLLKNAVPSGNLYAGGLGSHYLLLEYCDFLAQTADVSHQHPKTSATALRTNGPVQRGAKVTSAISPSKKAQTSNPSTPSQYSPIRCKRLIQQILDATQQALEKFERDGNTFKNKHNKLTPSSLSILEDDWMGAQALKAVCLYRLERLQKKLNSQQHPTKNAAASLQKIQTSPWKQLPPPPPPPGPPPAARRKSSSRLTTPTKSSLYKQQSNTPSPRAKNDTVATPPKQQQAPKYQEVLDTILARLRLIENPDLAKNVFYNYDVVGGRAGALQLIWWLRNELSKGDGGGEEYATFAQDIVVSIAIDMIQQGLKTADEMRRQSQQSDLPQLPQDKLFWVYDSLGKRSPLLCASRGVVGILYTVLGLHPDDWTLVEETIPKARQYVRNTIDLFCKNVNNAGDEEKENDGDNHNVGDDDIISDLEEEERETDQRTSSKDNAFVAIHRDRLRQQKQQEYRMQVEKFQKRILFESGNLRPFLDAPADHDMSVDWFQGATGLAMLFLQASQVFQSQSYLQEAHRMCDTIIFPRGIETTPEKSHETATTSTNTRLAWSNNSSRHRRTLYNISTPTNNDNIDSRNNHHRFGLHNEDKSKGPSGMASMAFCFLMLSEQCGGTDEATTLSLWSTWKSRALHYAQHAEKQWMKQLGSVPISAGGRNPFSLYEGMGALASVLWQLAATTQPTVGTQSIMSTQMPFFLGGCRNNMSNEAKVALSFYNVCVQPPKKIEVPPLSPPHNRRSTLSESSPSSSPKKVVSESTLTKEEQEEAERRRILLQQRLEESRKRRAKAEKEALRRKALEEAAKQKKLLEEKERKAKEEEKRNAQLESRQRLQLEEKERKAIEDVKRKAQLESRKRLQEVSRKATAVKIREEVKRREDELESKKSAEKSKRESLLLKRRQAQGRVEAQRKEKEEKERQKAEDIEKKRKSEIAAKQEKAEAESQKRQEMMDRLQKAKKQEAELAKDKERLRKFKEREENKRNEEDLRRREEERRKRDEERRRRMSQVRAKEEIAKKRKEEDQQQLKVELEEQRRQNEKRKLLADEEQRKQRDELLKKKAAAEKQRARDKAKKEKELEELKFKKQLEKALKLEEDRQKLREKQRKREEAQAKRLRQDLAKKDKAEKERLNRIAELSRKKEEERKKRIESLHRLQQRKGGTEIKSPAKQKTKPKNESIGMTPAKVLAPSIREAYSPEVLKRKEAVKASHFSLPTRPSSFWSLQSDTNIGKCGEYSVALVKESELDKEGGDSVASLSQMVTNTCSDLTCDDTASEPTTQSQQSVHSSEGIGETVIAIDTIARSVSLPRRRKGVDPTQRIKSLTKIVEGTLELKKQL